jgi:uncharacterized protein (TIGR02246 family)
MGRVEDAVDRLELRELVERYAFGADTRDRETFGEVFTEDGVLAMSTGRTYDGRDAIVLTLDHLDAHYPRSMHFVGNPQVVLDGDTATGLVYCLAHHMYERDGEERDTLMVIRYRDEYRRTDDGWRITAARCRSTGRRTAHSWSTREDHGPTPERRRVCIGPSGGPPPTLCVMCALTTWQCRQVGVRIEVDLGHCSRWATGANLIGGNHGCCRDDGRCRRPGEEPVPGVGGASSSGVGARG